MDIARKISENIDVGNYSSNMLLMHKAMYQIKAHRKWNSSWFWNINNLLHRNQLNDINPKYNYDFWRHTAGLYILTLKL